MFSLKADILKKNYGKEEKGKARLAMQETKVPTARKGNEFVDPEDSLAGGENGSNRINFLFIYFT